MFLRFRALFCSFLPISRACLARSIFSYQSGSYEGRREPTSGGGPKTEPVPPCIVTSQRDNVSVPF